ncbi:hypothetical protein CGLO_07165 [Colletotrichum gloeosporioides Cg-14]|uniref:Fungal N-terminal domain-containing protein n=1 Tax=Colletotrichum gloeosporioides (strain Cg-14) TaxID=1237896 RepID=T0KMD8_COLGC|nr:hypothetical protein CGLO_07165 [Colletotrichum gloeosporioides Cg-14]
MSFGWSAGDIAAAIKLVYNVYEALDSSAGASRDYRDAVTFLKSLIHTLNTLTGLADWEAYPAYREDIKRQVELIRSTVTEFLQSIEKYESSLGRSAKSGRLRQFAPKLKWHMLCAKQTLVLKSRIQSHMSVLNIVMHRLAIDVVIKTQKDLPELCRSVFQDAIRPELTATLTDALQQDFVALLKAQKEENQKFEQSILGDLQDMKKSFEPFASSIMHARIVDVSAAATARPPHAVDTKSYHSRAIGLPNSTIINGHSRDCLEELYYLVLVYLGHFLRDLFILLSRIVRPTKQLVPDLVAKFHLTFFDAVGGAPRVLQYDAFRSFEVILST